MCQESRAKIFVCFRGYIKAYVKNLPESAIVYFIPRSIFPEETLDQEQKLWSPDKILTFAEK